MSNTIQILSDMLKKSDLTEKEQEIALDYFNRVTNEELNTTVQTFKNNPETITKFWRILNLKTVLLNLIAQTNNLSEKEKSSLTTTISKMDEAAFTIFINALSNAKNATGITEELQKIFTSYKKINSEIINKINKLTEK